MHNSKGFEIYIESGGTAIDIEGNTMTTLEEFENTGNTFSDNASGEVSIN